jgi:hypothetical protein
MVSGASMPNPNPSPATRFKPGAEWRGKPRRGPMPPRTPERQARLDRQRERRRLALSLRLAGATYEAIGRQLGCSGPGALHLVTRAVRDVGRDPAEQLLKLELDRLDRLHRTVWTRALNGDVEALDRVLRLMARRAKLLGLDAPARHDVRETGVPAAEPEPDLTAEEVDAFARLWIQKRRLESADGEGR